MAKRRTNVTIPRDVIAALDALPGPVNKSKIVSDALVAELERFRREGPAKVVELKVVNYSRTPIILTFDDARPLRLERSSADFPPPSDGVAVIVEGPMAGAVRAAGWDRGVWPVSERPTS